MGKAYAGPPPLFLYPASTPTPPTPTPHTCSPSSPTGCRVHLSENSEVNDTRSEVEGCLLAVVDHGDAVAVPVAGPWHATLEDGEGQPAGTGVGWVGAPHNLDSHGRGWQLASWSTQGSGQHLWHGLRSGAPSSGKEASLRVSGPPPLPDCSSTRKLGGRGASRLGS